MALAGPLGGFLTCFFGCFALGVISITGRFENGNY
jgi:hypothetical protein